MSALPESLVIDASVAVKWYCTEEFTEQARRVLMAPSDLRAPELLFAEVANVLWKRTRRGELGLELAFAALDALNDVPLSVHSTPSLLRPALEIAAGLDRTVYDALYLALAVRHDAVLVTADRRLYNSISSSPLADHILWLADVPTGGTDAP